MLEALVAIGGPILSFLGGSAFRMIWGEISAAWTKRQDHTHEIQLLEAQDRMAGHEHSRNLEAIRVQAELGVKTIQVQAEARQMELAGEIEKEDARGWYGAVVQAMKPVGIWFIDAWNGAIRPAGATIALYLWVRAVHAQHWVMTPRDENLVFAILGFFLADRTLSKRGK
jgi:hypothetical protein